jgi:hypothetical protein
VVKASPPKFGTATVAPLATTMPLYAIERLNPVILAKGVFTTFFFVLFSDAVLSNIEVQSIDENPAVTCTDVRDTFNSLQVSISSRPMSRDARILLAWNN